MKSIGRKVIIRPDTKDEVTSSGIIKVSVSTDVYAEGTVISAGTETKYVKKDDHIIYSPLTYDEISSDETIYHVVDEDDIFAIIE